MDRCVGDLHSDHHGDGSLPPKAPRRGGVRRVGGGLLGRGGGLGGGNGAGYHPSLNQNAAVVNRRGRRLPSLRSWKFWWFQLTVTQEADDVPREKPFAAP